MFLHSLLWSYSNLLKYRYDQRDPCFFITTPLQYIKNYTSSLTYLVSFAINIYLKLRTHSKLLNYSNNFIANFCIQFEDKYYLKYVK